MGNPRPPPMEEARPGKTGLYDEAILIDNVLLFPALAALIKRRAPLDSLWDLPLDEELRIFGEGLASLRLEALGLCRYSMRHGGVCHDLMTKFRTLDEAQRRGRWRTATSLRRYGKETRVLSELRKVPTAVLDFGGKILLAMDKILTGTAPALMPPIV